MIKSLITLLFVTLVGLASAQNAAEVFRKQIERSCQAGFTLTKSVVSQGKPGEVKQYPLTSGCVCAADADFQLQEELEYAFKYDYSAPKLATWYKVETTGGTTTATLAPAHQGKTPLRYQAITWSADRAVMRKIVSRVTRASWLYDSEFEIEVRFDAAGRYEGHVLRFLHQVSFTGSRLEGMIINEANYRAQ